MNIPNPDGTRKPCPRGCGHMTVEAHQFGRTVRVHCGTFEPRCPR